MGFFSKFRSANNTPSPVQFRNGMQGTVYGSSPAENYIKGENHERYLADLAANTRSVRYDSPKVQYVPANSIEGIKVSESEEAGFWSEKQKGGTRESFDEVASHIPEVRQRLDAGESLDSISKDENLSDCARIYFRDMPEVTDRNGYYEFNENGRHRIMAAQDMGYDIPVKVTGAEIREEDYAEWQAKQQTAENNDMNQSAEENVSQGYGSDNAYTNGDRKMSVFGDISPERLAALDENQKEDLRANYMPGNYSDFSYEQQKAIGDPYKYDSEIESQKVKGYSLGPSDTRSREVRPARDSYISDAQIVRENYPDWYLNDESRQGYYSDLSRLQEQHGYYPELDRQRAYDDGAATYNGIMNSDSVSPEDKQYLNEHPDCCLGLNGDVPYDGGIKQEQSEGEGLQSEKSEQSGGYLNSMDSAQADNRGRNPEEDNEYLKGMDRSPESEAPAQSNEQDNAYLSGMDKAPQAETPAQDNENKLEKTEAPNESANNAPDEGKYETLDLDNGIDNAPKNEIPEQSNTPGDSYLNDMDKAPETENDNSKSEENDYLNSMNSSPAGSGGQDNSLSSDNSIDYSY